MNRIIIGIDLLVNTLYVCSPSLITIILIQGPNTVGIHPLSGNKSSISG